MERRVALAGAGGIAVIALAGAMAIGGAFGIIGAAGTESKTGKFSPADVKAQPVKTPKPIVETIVVDVPAPRSAVTAPPAAPASATQSQPVVEQQREPAPDNTTAPRAVASDDEGEDHSGEDEDHANEDDPSLTADHANEDHEVEDD